MYNLPAINSNLTKTDLSVIAEHSVKSILENANILEVADVIAKMEFLIKEIKGNREYVEYLRDQVAQYGRAATFNGTKIELAEVGTKYDFSRCDDPILAEMQQKADALDEEIKNRQAFLKTLPLSGQEIIVGDEIIKAFPPSKTSTSSYKVTLQK